MTQLVHHEVTNELGLEQKQRCIDTDRALRGATAPTRTLQADFDGAGPFADALRLAEQPRLQVRPSLVHEPISEQRAARAGRPVHANHTQGRSVVLPPPPLARATVVLDRDRAPDGRQAHAVRQLFAIAAEPRDELGTRALDPTTVLAHEGLDGARPSAARHNDFERTGGPGL